MTLGFHQIYFKESQKAELYPFAIPYDNNRKLTDYFENAVIAELVPKCEADYIAVCSWALKMKRETGSTPRLLREDTSLSEEKILNSGADVCILTPMNPGHMVMTNLYKWHYTQDIIEAVNELKKFIRIPEEIEGNAIYQNHFVARKEIYHQYVTECLIPCMEFMKDREIFFRDSKYAEKKIRLDPEGLKDYQKASGRQDWPLAPFLLERLFMFWSYKKQFKIANV